MQSFLIALQFLTRLPLKIKGEWQAHLTANSVLYYPLVGLFLGLILLLISAFISAQSPLLISAILLTSWVMLTGGLHLDGLADSADAWAGGLGDKEKSLAIMKDPQSGPLAVVILMLTLLLKFTAIESLLQTDNIVLITIPLVLARAGVLLLFLTTPYVRQQGLGSAIAEHLPRHQAKLVVLVSFISGWLLIDLVPLLVVTAVTLTTFYSLRALMLKRIEGMTGDTAGASIEILETVILIALVLMIS